MHIAIKTRDGDLSATLKTPASLSTQSAILRASVADQYLAGIAALGQCWVGPNRPGPVPRRMGHKVLAYAQAVEEALLLQGARLPELGRVSGVAFGISVRGVIPDVIEDGPSDPVGEAEVFSEAQAARIS